MIAPGFRRASFDPLPPRRTPPPAGRPLAPWRAVALPLPDGRYVLPDLRIVPAGPGGEIPGYREVRRFDDGSILVEGV